MHLSADCTTPDNMLHRSPKPLEPLPQAIRHSLRSSLVALDATLIRHNLSTVSASSGILSHNDTVT